MISYLSGKIKNINEKSLTLLTQSGVGYSVFLTINTLFSLKEGEELDILIHTVVKDDAINLYGFTKEEELFMFEKLITVSGVGPRSALNILSVSSIQNIAIAVENGDANLLNGVPGVGKKSCEKIVIELKGKLSKFIKENINSTDHLHIGEESDARLALISLGYSEKEVNNAIKETKENKDLSKKKANEIIKDVLKYLR
ncbi:MAG: Holliday junction branch migration protein RuvA [Candidatus Pacebacteria bacterium]|nr:Holliday junction branch migration protein RuvA [Candidatus Paceibacterota bacterium]